MTKKLQAEYKQHEDFITAVVEDRALNNEIRMTDDKMFLVTLQNAHEDVKAGKEILCADGDIERSVTAIQESKYNWKINYVKLHNKDYEYINREKKLYDIDLEMIKEINKKHLRNYNPLFNIVLDNGRKIVAFISRGYHEEYSMSWEDSYNTDVWKQYGIEKRLSFSDEYDNYEIIVAEYWTEEKFIHELGKQAHGMCNAYYGIKKDTGRYSKYDVYSQKELL